MRLDITIEVVGNEIVIALVNDAVAQRGEAARVAELAGIDGGEDAGEVRVEAEVAVEVGVAEVFDVFGQVAEEEDVGLADFARYFDL